MNGADTTPHPRALRAVVELEFEEEPGQTPPKLTAVGRKRVRERFLMALELDPPGEDKFTPAQKKAYLRWLDHHLEHS